MVIGGHMLIIRPYFLGLLHLTCFGAIVCPSANEVTLKHMGKTTNQNETLHTKGPFY